MQAFQSTGLVHGKHQSGLGGGHRQHLERDLGDQPQRTHAAHHHAGDIVASHVFHDLATKDQFLPQAVDQMQAQHVFTHRTGTGAGWTTQTRSNHATDGRFAPFGGAARWSTLAQGLGVGGRGGR